MKTKRGFTLVEIMVAITIVSILTGVVAVKIGTAREKSRDVDRQGDLRALQSAIELYKNKNGRYPAGCNGADAWSGQLDSATYKCSSGNQYIVGLAPEFIPALPKDPRLNGAASGYVYTTNADGTVYKLMALNTVESESISPQHIFSRCGNTDDGTTECSAVLATPIGAYSGYNLSGSTPGQCTSGFGNDYALMGGFAAGGIWSGTYYDTPKAQEYFSDVIRCK